MRLLIAMMKHETNTFSPVPTPLARFGPGPGPLYGEAAIRAYRGTGTGLGAYLDLARREGAEIVLPVAAGARRAARSRTPPMPRSPTRSAMPWRAAASTASCSTCTAPW
jgi:microcystin degradation protein MlrC